MPYAIVDIETTGGYASANGITEISIIVHDGKRIIRQFETLINPGKPIPYYIRGLTGINDAMVANAPAFREVAEEIYEVLSGNIFIAHNVNFDYSFLKNEFAACGYDLNLKKLCTIRLSRKIFPGLASYGLGKICGNFNITIENRHRAGGDAEATVKLFELLLRNDNEGSIEKFLKKNSKERVLPPNLPAKQFEQLPDSPGVYYFHNRHGKIVYTGKAINIKKRVGSHFGNNSPNKQKQDFLRAIHSITYELCGSELMALILESHQIKHLWPEYNRSQKHFEAAFGIMQYHDQRGVKRLCIERVRKNQKPLAIFSNLTEGFSLIKKVTDDFKLCPRYTGIANNEEYCKERKCLCLSKRKSGITKYNKLVDSAIEALQRTESFVIVERGRNLSEHGLIYVENGVFKRMGYVEKSGFRSSGPSREMLEKLNLYRENFSIRQIIANYKFNHPEKVIMLDGTDEALAATIAEEENEFA